MYADYKYIDRLFEDKSEHFQVHLLSFVLYLSLQNDGVIQEILIIKEPFFWCTEKSVCCGGFLKTFYFIFKYLMYLNEYLIAFLVFFPKIQALYNTYELYQFYYHRITELTKFI